MATPKPTEFQEFSFTPEEEKQAQILPELNMQWIKNKLALTMTERAQLEYDPNQPITVFVQQEAALMGEINAYRFLLDGHATIIESLSSLDPLYNRGE